MKIRWLDLAIEDLEDIADYIARDNPGAAKRILARLWTAVQNLLVHAAQNAIQSSRPGAPF
jgi:plasmid stabilization system protein ParE